MSWTAFHHGVWESLLTVSDHLIWYAWDTKRLLSRRCFLIRCRSQPRLVHTSVVMNLLSSTYTAALRRDAQWRKGLSISRDFLLSLVNVRRRGCSCDLMNRDQPLIPLVRDRGGHPTLWDVGLLELDVKRGGKNTVQEMMAFLWLFILLGNLTAPNIYTKQTNINPYRKLVN